MNELATRDAPAMTVEAQDRIVEAVRVGVARSRAAGLARIAPTTLAEWIRRGEAGDASYVEFGARLAEAEAEAERSFAAVISEAATEDRDWKAAAWILERRWPDAWAPKPPVKDAFAGMTDEQLQAALKELEG